MGDEEYRDDAEMRESSLIGSGVSESAAPTEAVSPVAPGPAGTGAPAAAGAIYRVKVLFSSATEFCTAPEGLAAAVGDLVIVPTRYGNEVARVLGRETGLAPGAETREIVRTASPVDLSRLRENGVREEKAYETARERIASRGLDMKLVSAHYLLDEQKILFFFTAEERIDFRDLVRDLVSTFKVRIELRQIGVRDEARVVGGVGVCGRALCCNSITDRLRPVSIKMAKEQNLTLNSMKISGHCGRLLCCLAYEFDVYHEARATLPSMNARVRYEGEEFRVTDLDVLARRVRLSGATTGRVLDVGFEALVRNQKTQSWELKPRG
jgi:cell fate regulator YaaT (PSP1 superfamily)